MLRPLLQQRWVFPVWLCGCVDVCVFVYRVSCDAVSVSLTALLRLCRLHLVCLPPPAGICNTKSGLCSCFAGWYGERCQLKSALARPRGDISK